MKFHIHLYGPGRHMAYQERLSHLELLEDEDGPAGPHPEPQVGLVAAADEVTQVDLSAIAEAYSVSILVHPILEDEVMAHSVRAVWHGKEVSLNLNFFRA